MTRRIGTMRPWLAVSPLLLLSPQLRHLLEGQMTLHMLLQFPWLLASGAAACSATVSTLLARIDDQGLFTVTVLLCVSAFWMIPSALDLALLDDRAAIAKYLSWYAAGLVLASGIPRLKTELRVFLLGNLVWMLATAGWLIRESDARLCVSYLVSDQLRAGTGLIALALGLSAFGLLSLRRRPPWPVLNRH